MLKFSKCKAEKEKKKKCQLLFISYINTGNLVLPQNTGGLDELDSSQFILHRNGSLKKGALHLYEALIGRSTKWIYSVTQRCSRTNEGGMVRRRVGKPGVFIHSFGWSCSWNWGVPHYACVPGAFFNILINNNISPTRN